MARERSSLSKCIGVLLLVLTPAFGASAGPYSRGLNDPNNIWDAPVPGFVGLDGEGMARLSDGDGGFSNARNYVNPLFFGWATGWINYAASDTLTGGDWGNPQKALGPVTGDNFDIVALGDLSAAKLDAHTALPGRITLTFAKLIKNKPGADFVVFENALTAFSGTGGAGAGGIFAELAYLEVSSDGANFARFPCVSSTAAAVGGYGTIDPTNVFGLAGKHANADGASWGTPFDLSRIANDPLVVNGSVNLDAIRYARVVDIPGRGDYLDSQSHSIFDSWFTTGSGGFDLEALGVISQEITFNGWQDLQGLTGTARGAGADPDGDGIPNLSEYAFSLLPLLHDDDGPSKLLALSDRIGISFSRDTRKIDLTYEVQASSNLINWDTIAKSVAGAALAAVSPYSPTITDRSDSRIASVGVIRREEVADVLSFTQAPKRFLRVRVSLAP